jgi:hypothetical protein
MITEDDQSSVWPNCGKPAKSSIGDENSVNRETRGIEESAWLLVVFRDRS